MEFVKVHGRAEPLRRSEAERQGFHDPCNGDPWRKPPSWDPLALSSPPVWAEVEQTEEFLAEYRHALNERRDRRRSEVMANRVIAGNILFQTAVSVVVGFSWSFATLLVVLGWVTVLATIFVRLVMNRPPKTPSTGVIGAHMQALRESSETRSLVPPGYVVLSRAVMCQRCTTERTVFYERSSVCEGCSSSAPPLRQSKFIGHPGYVVLSRAVMCRQCGRSRTVFHESSGRCKGCQLIYEAFPPR